MTKRATPIEVFEAIQVVLDQKAKDKQSVNADEINMNLQIIQTDALCQILVHLEHIHTLLLQKEQRIIQ